MNKKLNNEIEKYEKEILLQQYVTDLKKKQFIDEIKNGLGQKIKENPNNFTIIKKTWKQKFMIFLKKIFTKF